MQRKNKIIIILFFLIAILILILTFYNSSKGESYSGNFQEIKLDSDMQSNFIINAGNSSSWDEHIREIGNIIYNPISEEYFFFYSGYNGEYAQNNVFVGMAYSNDGIKWEKYGKILNLSAEDTYLIIHNDTFYMFFEDKEEVPFRRVSLATSKDGRNWEVVKRGVINPSRFRFSWQHQDVSSPVVVRIEEGWVLIYEGRGLFNQGKFGYAFSKDLVNWKKKTYPIFSGGSYWDHHVVPDDIIFYNESYIISYHGYNKEIGDWQSGLAISNDLKHWETLTKDPISESETMMLNKNQSMLNFIEEKDKEVKIYSTNLF